MTSQTDSQSNPQTPGRDESHTPRRAEQLAEARRKARESGLSPSERSAQKIALALAWLYRWEWTAPATLDVVAGDTRGGYAQRLKRAHLVCTEEIIGSPGTRYRPRYAVTLTAAGVRAAMEALTEEAQIRATVKTGYRAIPTHQIEHDHRLQLLVLEWLDEGLITEYQTPAELAARSMLGEKRPDLIVSGGMMSDKTAIELELTGKSTLSSEKFFRDCLQGLRENRWKKVRIFCRSTAIQSRYQRMVDSFGSSEPNAFFIQMLES
jgi:hypothetical protein